MANPKEFSVNFIEKKVLGRIDVFNTLRVPVIKPLGVSADVIHAGNLLVHSKTPWFSDFEEITAYGHYLKPNLFAPQFKLIFTKYVLGKNCAGLLPWTRGAQKGLEYYVHKGNMDKQILEKSTVVYPFVSPKVKSIKRNDSKKKKLFFVGKDFYLKGGIDVIRAFEILQRKMDCELTIVGNIPPEIIEYGSKISGLRLIQSGPAVSDEFIANCYRSSDLFFFPTHMDTLGFAILDAMSYGLPVVSVDQFSVPEMVTNNGILMPNPYSDHAHFMKNYTPCRGGHPLMKKFMNPPAGYVRGLANACEKILSNDSLRRKMARQSLDAIVSGNFSKRQRIQTLGKLYRDAAQKGALP